MAKDEANQAMSPFYAYSIHILWIYFQEQHFTVSFAISEDLISR